MRYLMLTASLARQVSKTDLKDADDPTGEMSIALSSIAGIVCYLLLMD